MNCAECGTAFEPNRPQQIYCAKRCSGIARARKFKERHKGEKRLRVRYDTTPTACEIVDSEARKAAAVVGSPFASAMLQQAINDSRSEALDLASEARKWLRGEFDADLAEPCRAAVCFEAAGIDQGAALRKLNIS